jgi:DNA-binding transcriptional regulator YhcF (GntR family)
VLERRPGRPLVVRAQGTEDLHDSKREQIRVSLRPTVTMIRQLGVGKDEVLEIFRKMLAGETEEEES